MFYEGVAGKGKDSTQRLRGSENSKPLSVTVTEPAEKQRTATAEAASDQFVGEQ